jgi:hypothetical protein
VEIKGDPEGPLDRLHLQFEVAHPLVAEISIGQCDPVFRRARTEMEQLEAACPEVRNQASVAAAANASSRAMTGAFDAGQ